MLSRWLITSNSGGQIIIEAPTLWEAAKIGAKQYYADENERIMEASYYSGMEPPINKYRLPRVGKGGQFK